MRQWFTSLWHRRETPLAPYDAVADPRLETFQETIGVRFQDVELLRQALTHRSYLGCNGGDPHLSNERMEFLGDAVLELVVIEYLYLRFPGDREGALTKKKGLLVSRGVLSDSARWMDLGKHLFLSDAERDSGPTRSSILADAFEAVIGAIYLDRGPDTARLFIEQRLLKHADDIFRELSRANFKSQLQELVQARFKTPPRYRVVTEVGPDHRKLFTVEVSVRGKLLGRGQGFNKKEAQQNAAREAMNQLEESAAAEASDANGGLPNGSPSDESSPAS